MIIQYKIVRKIGELPQIGKGYVKQQVLLFRWKNLQRCMKLLALSWRR